MSKEAAIIVARRCDRRADVVVAIRREFDRWPRLALTLAQACRLWSLETTMCRDLLDALVEDGVLRQRADGTYVSRPIDFASLVAS
jgi:hypothetical protein